jgi:hypothetical protein
MAAIAGEHWKPEYERAWNQAFAIVAGAMLERAEQAEPRSTEPRSTEAIEGERRMAWAGR